MKVFEIDFIRQIISQTIELEHQKNPNVFIGSKNDYVLLSFYEHLKTQEEVNRFVDAVRDLNDQQNRTNLIMNGIVVAPTNPSITNINKGLIVPLDFSCNFRCTLEDRDAVKETLDNMVYKLKGRKRDVAVFDNGDILMVGTIANDVDGQPKIKAGDYVGEVTVFSNGAFQAHLNSYHLEIEQTENLYLYFGIKTGTGKITSMYVAYYDTINQEWIIATKSEEYNYIEFPPEHTPFKKFSVSISFDTSRCSEPRTLNSKDYCDVSFGGSATVVSEGIKLGNQLTKLSFLPYSIKGVGENNEDLDLTNMGEYWLEPLELPSGLSSNNLPSQLLSNNFKINSHTDGITPNIQYTFILDSTIPLLEKWFKYARYGITNNEFTSINENTGISPNIVYKVCEIWSSWGVVDIIEYYAKIFGDINIENTESDVLTIGVVMQIQGEN